MSDATALTDDPPPRRRRHLLLAALVLGVAGAGFGAGFSGLVSPRALMTRGAPVSGPMVGFIDLPRLTVPLAGRERQLILALKLEAAPADIPGIEAMLPRVADSFNRFLSDIDPAAIERRGVLEIIRAELAARADMVLGAGLVTDVLITEFAIQ
ncbi:MAG: flagellar basal body-associated FliL family protein [Paracoccus sp. (in: a-proteobacteria)]|nr:flagellar basal body-associated FliL family protein [Paracoccus sp. (in: a-proteobacteria)]